MSGAAAAAPTLITGTGSTIATIMLRLPTESKTKKNKRATPHGLMHVAGQEKTEKVVVKGGEGLGSMRAVFFNSFA